MPKSAMSPSSWGDKKRTVHTYPPWSSSALRSTSRLPMTSGKASRTCLTSSAEASCAIDDPHAPVAPRRTLKDPESSDPACTSSIPTLDPSPLRSSSHVEVISSKFFEFIRSVNVTLHSYPPWSVTYVSVLVTTTDPRLGSPSKASFISSAEASWLIAGV
jgi:hypothetical protein